MYLLHLPNRQGLKPLFTGYPACFDSIYSQSSQMNPYSLITDPSRVQKHTQPMYSAPTIKASCCITSLKKIYQVTLSYLTRW